MSGIDIIDYNAGDETSLQDPTDPYDQVEKVFMDKLAKAITHAEEALQAGTVDIDGDEFIDRRGDFLDLMDDPQIVTWLQWMRQVNRAPFRKFAVDLTPPPPEEEDDEQG